MSNTDLNALAQQIETLLKQEKSFNIQSRDDLKTSSERRNVLNTLTSQLEEETYQLTSCSRQLKDHPPTDVMDWAEAVLAMQNLAIVVLDTTSLGDNADIIRIHAINEQGECLIDQIIKPGRELTPNTAWTGISQDELDAAPTIKEAWEGVIRALHGHFVVSFNLDFVKDRLHDNIEHYELDRLPMIGACLMAKAKKYFGIDIYGSRSGLKLPEACAKIGKPMPYHPPLAAERAAGCIYLLHAMEKGVTSAPASSQDDDLDPLDDHPF